MSRIIVFIHYFGVFPDWIEIYFETLRRNPDIDFYFFTDCDMTPFAGGNIMFETISFTDYKKSVREKTGWDFDPPGAYKICDLRPMFGYLHNDLIKGYNFYGWTDVDIIFGNIRQFITEDILKKYDVISMHQVRISGHFALFRNTEENINKFRGIYDWQNALKKPEFVGIDEHGLTNAYTLTFIDKINLKFKRNIKNRFGKWLAKRKRKKMYLQEQYTTPFTVIPWIDRSVNSAQPETWFYKNGSVTNSRDGERKFIYLHLMNFKSSQWRHDNTKAPWEGMNVICSAKVSDLEKGIVIDKTGIHPMI